MVKVNVKKGETINRALLRFKKRCQRAGIKNDLKKHLRYEKPSARRRRKRRQNNQK